MSPPWTGTLFFFFLSLCFSSFSAMCFIVFFAFFLFKGLCNFLKPDLMTFLSYRHFLASITSNVASAKLFFCISDLLVLCTCGLTALHTFHSLFCILFFSLCSRLAVFSFILVYRSALLLCQICQPFH